MTPEHPGGEIPFPQNISTESEGFVLIVLDGIGRENFLDSELMPEINRYRDFSATVNIETGPLTLSATCISEMMTGVPNAPINGLRNFDLTHPGQKDPWLLAAADERYNVAMVGSYVMGNLYKKFDDINFVNTFKGHSDYYQGDQDTLEVATDWLQESEYNVLAVHFSGPDKVGHTWGADSPEYERKLTDVDKQVSELLKIIPNQWSVVITADHGMTDMGTHGSSEEITREVAAIISGPQIIARLNSDGHQRDLSAILPLLLELPFPVQLHGRIPLDIFDYSDEDKLIIEQWNWEAAYQRQVFFDEKKGVENTELSIEKIDWDLIPSDGEFSRNIDIYISVITWMLIAFFAILAMGLTKEQIFDNWKLFVAFFSLITLFLFSHALLEYSAMLPRAIGGLCAVWLVGWSLSGRKQDCDDSDSKFLVRLDEILHNSSLWILIPITLSLLFWSILVGVIGSLFIYSILYSCYSGFRKSKKNASKFSPILPWMLILLSMTYGSIRLWYALIPFFFILIGLFYTYIKQNKSTIEKLPIISMLMITFFAVFFVHRRIYGEHYIFEAVETGWPNSISKILISSMLLILSAIVSATAFCKVNHKKKSVIFSAWLIFGLIVSALESTYLDTVALILVLGGYVKSIHTYVKDSEYDLAIEIMTASLSMQLLLTWGAWSTFATLLVLSSSGKVWRIISTNYDNKIRFDNAKPLIAMAVFPWVIWILWWTLLGQVNGLQTCFEGICPHPRELDPGSVIVRGGYVGAREDPNLYWMIFMIASPLIITTLIMMNNLQKSGLNLYPYILFQALIILGCISIIGFSPKYPRLVFSLTWNIFFAVFQLIHASIIHALKKLYSEGKSGQINLAEPIAHT